MCVLVFIEGTAPPFDGRPPILNGHSPLLVPFAADTVRFGLLQQTADLEALADARPVAVGGVTAATRRRHPDGSRQALGVADHEPKRERSVVSLAAMAHRRAGPRITAGLRLLTAGREVELHWLVDEDVVALGTDRVPRADPTDRSRLTVVDGGRESYVEAAGDAEAVQEAIMPPPAVLIEGRLRLHVGCGQELHREVVHAAEPPVTDLARGLVSGGGLGHGAGTP
jgi:hypothetical protein